MGLRTKLLLLWFVLLLAPLTILGSIGYAYIDSQLRREALDYQSDLVHSISSAVDNYFERLTFLAWSTGMYSRLPDLLASEVAEPAQFRDGLATGNLQRMLSLVPTVREFRVVLGESFTEPLVVKTRNHLPPLDLSSLDLSAQDVAAAKSRTQVYYLPADDNEGDHLITALRLTGDDNQLLGYLLSATSVSSLENIVMPQPANEAQLFVVDPVGNLLSEREKKALEDLGSLKGKLPATDSDNLQMEDFALGQKHYMLAMKRLENGFWLVSLTDHDIIFAKKLPYIIVFVAALSLTLVLSGVIFNLVVDNIAIKPIQKLIQATRQIAKGDLKPELDVRSQDELGELAVSFRQMGKQLLHTSRRIRQLAYFDPLTQLPNRTTLRETLSRLLSRAAKDGSKAAVLFIDLDDFKKVNDRLGHEAGDELLIQISHRLKNRLRQADILVEHAGISSVEQLISRRGGDEFNAILTDLKAPHDAAIVAERIIQDLNEPFHVGHSEIHVGASIGVAIFPDDGKDADTLLRNADLAMYEAKAKGKNNYHIFTSAINEQVHQRLALENSLQVAMVQSQFRLYYQPKVSLSDMTPVGFEALVRWKHPEKGMILPSKFIPVAEESNLIRDIGNWILAESMQQIQLWDKKLPRDLRIAINISARQLAQTDLVDQLRMMMEHFSIPADRLEIELTETSVLQDEAMAIQHLRDLRSLGVEVSLDDFGTGYSSLSFLRKLPIDTVKIDRSFTANITQNGEARAIVISLLNLCKELKVKTIAEGIETPEQLQFLMEHGCDQGQGFLFSKPLPAHKVMAFLAEPSYLALS
ncbi:EAL domain-containing protein [Proteobacteria bacterium 005FR1]|nr:EAL domain-containing protein [Proteobacteria bacterium 005FR1]